jgi:tetratricopeptide (TPR) repeat protein
VTLEEALQAQARDDTVQASELLERGLSELEASAAPEKNLEARYHNALGRLLVDDDRADEALPHFERTYELRREELGETHSVTSLALLNVAVGAAGSGDTSRARVLMERACSQLVNGKGPPRLAAACWTNLGGLEVKLGRDAVAVTRFERALELEAMANETETLAETQTRGWLGAARYRTGQYKAAIEDLSEAIAAMERIHGVGSVQALELMVTLGQAHLGSGDVEAARSLLSRCLQAWPPEDQRGRRKVEVWLALASNRPEAIQRLETVLASPEFEQLIVFDRSLARFSLARRLDDSARALELATSAYDEIRCETLGEYEKTQLLEPLQAWLQDAGWQDASPPCSPPE